jgi:hypothetical protein
MLSPETFPIILAHEPIAASSIIDTSDAISLKNAKGVLIVFVHATNSCDVDVALTVHEGATAAEATAGTYPVAATFPIWVTTNCTTTDVPVRQANAAGYTVLAHALTGNSLVFMYVPSGVLTNGRSWVHLGTDTGGSGLAAALYILDGERYQQATPPTAVA